VGQEALQVSREMATQSFLVSSLCGTLGGLPAELWLVVQCLGQVVVRVPLKRVQADM
jgi:hypothetical protein